MQIKISMSKLLVRATSLNSGGDVYALNIRGDGNGQPETGLRETERIRANRAKK